jgi:hypothetical protein
MRLFDNTIRFCLDDVERKVVVTSSASRLPYDHHSWNVCGPVFYYIKHA